MASFRCVSAAALRRLVPMGDAISAIRQVFVEVDGGNIEQPPRLVVRDGRLIVMPAGDRGKQGDAVKIVTVTPENADGGAQTVQGLVLWFDANSGSPMAVMEGASLTALRSGAATGVATDLLAPKLAHTLAMIGVGGQAMDQIRAVCSVRPIRQVRVASRHYSNAQRFVRERAAEFPGTSWMALPTPAEAVEGAEVVCTATLATVPLFSPGDLCADVHINAIGAFRPTMVEIPAEVISGASVVAIDFRDAALEEAGDILAALAVGAIVESDLVELGQLLRQGRVERVGRTIFKSVGIAAQDWAIAALAVQRAATDSKIPSIDLFGEMGRRMKR